MLEEISNLQKQKEATAATNEHSRAFDQQMKYLEAEEKKTTESLEKA